MKKPSEKKLSLGKIKVSSLTQSSNAQAAAYTLSYKICTDIN